MPATIIHAIRSASGWASMSAGEQAAYAGHYTLLSAWEAGEQRDLVVADEIAVAECYHDWPDGLNDNVVIDGSVTDATRYMQVRCAPGHAPSGTVYPSAGGFDGFYLKADVNAALIDVRQDHTTISDLGGYNVKTSLAYTKVFAAVAANVTFERLIAESKRNSAILMELTSGSDGYIQNCLTFVHGAVNAFHLVPYAGNNIYLQNSEAVQLTTGGTGFSNVTPARDVDLRNSVAIGFSTPFSAGGFDHASSTNNAASDGATNTPPGSNPLTVDIVAADFVDAANGDFRLSAGSQLKEAGVDLSAFFATDIAGETRTLPFSIGAFNNPTGGGAVTGTGNNQAQDATHSGTGERVVVSTDSSHQSQSSTHSGSGERVITGAGSHQAGSSTHSGTGERVVVSTDTVHQAQDATHSGSGGQAADAVTGTGNHQSQDATHSGTGERVVVSVDEAHQAGSSTHSGTAERVVVSVDEAHQAQDATHSGRVLVAGFFVSEDDEVIRMSAVIAVDSAVNGNRGSYYEVLLSGGSHFTINESYKTRDQFITEWQAA